MSDVETGDRLGRYEIVTELATGGMAELYLARERGIGGLERLVVIKRIKSRLADDPSFVDMFLREARIVARLNHPNIVQIFELGEEHGSYFIAMEYIHGSTVRELQVLGEREGVDFPIEIALTIAAQACKGLQAAHELRDLEGKPLNLVHRDVSPHNLMCTRKGYVKLLDFGVAKSTKGVEQTYSGNLKGKFAYMSPEQCQGEDLDPRSDIFGLGIVLWEMLTGKRLFKRQKDLDMMRAVLKEDAPPPSDHNPDVTPEIDAVVLKSLEKDREDRFDSATEMRRALIEAARDAGVHIGEDELAEFTRKVAGEQLDERRETMQDAMERSLSSRERDHLLHVTGSDSRSAASISRADADTVIERPSSDSGSKPSGSHSSVSHSGSRRRPAPDRSGSIPSEIPAGPDPSNVWSSQDDFDDERPVSDANGGSSSLPLLFLALFVGIVAAGGALYLFPDTFGDPLGLTEASESDEILIGEPIRVGWAPIAPPEILRDEIVPLDAYFESELGRPVEMEVTGSYGELQDGLLSGRFDFGIMPPLLYTRTKIAEPDIELLAIREFDGANSSDALLLTPMDSRVRSLDDLEGKTFCFTDKNSTTGNFLPRAFIRRNGYDTDEFIGKVHWSGNHLQALEDLMDGKCDAAATYSGNFIAAERFGIPTGQIRTLAITGHVPQDSFVAAPHVSESLADRIATTLLAFDPETDANTDMIGETLRITGFQPGEDSAFDDIRRAIDELEADERTDAGQLMPEKDDSE
ncbi:MAG: serine/threonine-protein kinase [Myxococcota bacterium]